MTRLALKIRSVGVGSSVRGRGGLFPNLGFRKLKVECYQGSSAGGAELSQRGTDHTLATAPWPNAAQLKVPFISHQSLR